MSCLALSIFLVGIFFWGSAIPSDSFPHRITEYVSICDIQGDGFVSPYVGKKLRTRGVVTLDLEETGKHGFFMQDENCDRRGKTSDGIYIYHQEVINLVQPGDRIEVQGYVNEYYGLTEIISLPEDILLLSSGNPLPMSLELSPPFESQESRKYYESREGMMVSLSEALAVGPTDADDRNWLIRSDLGLGRVFQGDPAGIGEIICVDDRGIFKINPDLKVGARVNGLQGALDFSYSDYCVQLSVAPVVVPDDSKKTTGKLDEETEPTFTIATFNLNDLFDTVDDPYTDDTRLSPTEYQRRLQKRAMVIHEQLGEPDLIAVQEAENMEVLLALASRPEIQSTYQFLLLDGPDTHGIDVGFIYKPDRFQLLEFGAYQGCTTLIDGLGPDGNQDVHNPQNVITCDTDADGIADGNRLFSRPPLVVKLRANFGIQDDFWLVNNHWKSKAEDTDATEFTLPRRLGEAQFLSNLTEEIRISEGGANLIILGDLNDFPNSQPLSLLTDEGFFDITQNIDSSNRYTYIYHGISQVLDYILLNKASTLNPLAVIPIHINADYPYRLSMDETTFHRSSDHDPLIVQFSMPGYQAYLPIIRR